MSGLIPLVCTQCGGAVKIDSGVFKIVETANSIVIKSGNDKFVCSFCKTEFLAGDEIKKSRSGGDIHVGNITGNNGAIAIGHGAVAVSGNGSVAVSGNANSITITRRG